MTQSTAENDRIPITLITICFGFSCMLRILIGFGHHSGENNHHGSATAYGGDFEAQRHWMEITYWLPVGDWYWYDLEYWGLDYPPLTAYHSYLCGWLSHHLVGPQTVALDSSRGIEDPVHKAFMRATVLVFDFLIFGTVVWYSSFRNDRGSMWVTFITLNQPAILLVDHGHFQYNSIALGFSIAAFAFISQKRFRSCIYGSILFCLALNFKQMTLYYAPAVFFYLLGRCISTPKRFLQRFMQLGVTVLTCFGVLWLPFIMNGPSDMVTTPIERAMQILRRIFPFERGLFEGKVSNLWCALNTRPISIRDRIDSSMQPLLALVLTLIMIAPSSFALFRLGMKGDEMASRKSNNQDRWKKLLWGSMSCSLSFFLASFQVHEKSILMSLAPCSLLLWEDPKFVLWFSRACTWTLWPLLQVDRLHAPYFCMLIIFEALIHLGQYYSSSKSSVFSGIFSLVPGLTYAVMIGLHATEFFFGPPAALPDLYPVLWSVLGCAMFCLAYIISCAKVLMGEGKSKVE
mmetsp:Transcript_1979/g.4463  ORF Transcript_1979/g.4463 Transcript_1979/m.4463 type:complete len:517 (-) Transcript_1979:134-1684(-)